MKALLPIILLLSLVAPVKAKGINPDFHRNQINCGELAEYYDHYVASLSGSRANSYKVGFFKGYVIGFVVADKHDEPMISAEQLLHSVGGHAKANYGMWQRTAFQCVHGALKRLRLNN